MLIALDRIIYPYRQPAGEPRPTELIHLNPEKVTSVNALPTKDFGGQIKCCVTMDCVNGDDQNDEWTILGHANDVAQIINAAIISYSKAT